MCSLPRRKRVAATGNTVAPSTVSLGPRWQRVKSGRAMQRTSCIADAAARPTPGVLYLGNSRVLKEIPKPAAKIRTGK
jgi:hypothetical protein